MRLPLAEEQELLKTRSLKEKSLKFLDILIEQKESIKFQMEMVVKFNEEMNKNHRANTLKEQLKAIQEELNDREGMGGKKKDYRELISESAMPE
jgi:ATP-dependent Lon protease